MTFGVTIFGYAKGSAQQYIGTAWVEAMNYDEALGIAQRYAQRRFPHPEWDRVDWRVSSFELLSHKIDEVGAHKVQQ